MASKVPKDKKLGLMEAAAPTYGVTVSLDKDMAEKIQIGDEISVMLSGKVRAIRDDSYTDQPSKRINVEISAPTITSVAMNAADFEMKRMVG